MSTATMTDYTRRQAKPGAPHLSEILPLPGSTTSIFSSALLLPGLFTAVAVCLLFYFGDQPEAYFRIIAYYFVLVLVTVFYQNSSVTGRVLSLVFSAVIVAGILKTGPLLDLFLYLFRDLPGLVEPQTPEFAANFAYHFVAAGLMEELIKVIPALIGLAIALIAARLAKGEAPSGWLVDRIGVTTPMQGLLMGMAAGGAFTLVETLELYVPNIRAVTSMQVAESMMSGLQTLPDDPKMAEALTAVVNLAAEKSGVSSGMFLLLPRIMGALIGHMSYAGIFGYFIGLAGRCRGFWVIPLVLIGWGLSSAVHAAWNAGGSTPMLMMAMGLLAFGLFFSYYLKAHPTPPQRRERGRA